jgi:hypothetical protein
VPRLRVCSAACDFSGLAQCEAAVVIPGMRAALWQLPHRDGGAGDIAGVLRAGGNMAASRTRSRRIRLHSLSRLKQSAERHAKNTRRVPQTIVLATLRRPAERDLMSSTTSVF